MEEPARRRPRRVPASGILVSLESSVAVLNRILTAAAVGVDGGGGVWRSRIVEKNILSKRITDILALIRERGERVLEEEEEAVEDGEEATRGNSPCKTRQNQQRLLARKCRLVLVSRNNAIWKQHQQQPLDQVQEDDADDDHFEDIRSAGEPSSTNGLVLVNHHSRSWFSILHHPSSHRYSVLTRLLEIIKHLLDSNTLTTKRDVYYKDVNLFVSQTVVDKAIEDLAFSFGVPRFCLNVIAASKGLVAGHLLLHMKNGSQINCLNCGDQGILTPPSELIESLETDAELVLVIEKEAVFRSLAMLHLWDMPTGEDQDVITISSGGEVSVGNERVMNDKVEDSNNSNYYTAATATAASTTTTTAKTSKTIKKCILITGKGYPDIATRQLLVRLSQLKKPRQQQQHSSSLCSKLSSTSSSPSSSSSQPLALDTLPIPEPSSSSLISSSFPYLSSPFIASRSANNDSASIAVSENYHHHTAMCSPLKSMLVFDDHHDSMNSIDLPVDDGVPDVLFDLKEEIEILGENYEDKQLFHMETDDDIGWIVDNQVEEKYQPEDEVQEDNLHLEEVHLVFTPDDCSVEAGLSLLTDLHADTVLVQEEEIEMDLEEMFLMGSGRARQQYDHVNSSRRHDHLPDDGEIELDMSECFASTLSSPNIAGVLEFDYQVPTFDILQEELFEMKTLDQILPDLGCYGGGGRYESYSNNNNDINMFRCLKNTTEDESIGFKIDPLHEHDGFPSEDAMVMEEEVELHLILEDATSADEDGYSGEQQQQEEEVELQLILEDATSADKDGYSGEQQQQQVVNLRNTQQPAEHQSLQVHQVPQQNSILNICALVDCDPHGFEIFLTYAHGSKAMSLESNSLACPRLHLLGILSSDLVHRNVPQSQLIPFSVEDWKKCAQLCKRIVADAGRSAGDGGGGGGGVSTGRSFDKQLRSVLGKMMHCGYKAEIQCFETEDLCSSYLKEKLDHLPSLF